MKTSKKKLLWQLLVVALSLTTAQAVLASDDDDDVPVGTVPDSGATGAMLAGALLCAEVLRRNMKRP
jgi:hypothetical protein